MKSESNPNESRETRNEIVSLLKAVDPFDEIEREHIADAVNWIESGVEIFRLEKPATPLKHLVCYTALFDPIRNKLLLLEHQKAELLLVSGGHVDKGELPAEAAKREMQEELGMEAEFLQSDQRVPLFVSQLETVGKTPGHIDVDLWYLMKGDSEKPLHSETEEFQREFGGYNWYGLADILSMPIEKFDPNLHRFINKIKAKFTNQ